MFHPTQRRALRVETDRRRRDAHVTVLGAPCLQAELFLLRRQRVTEAVGLVESRRAADGRWHLEVLHPGRMPIEIDDGEGRPSRWNTMRALRVLKWFSPRSL